MNYLALFFQYGPQIISLISTFSSTSINSVAGAQKLAGMILQEILNIYLGTSLAIDGQVGKQTKSALSLALSKLGVTSAAQTAVEEALFIALGVA